MKKWFAFFLCFMLLFTTAGCGNKNSSDSSGTQPSAADDTSQSAVADSNTQSPGTDAINKAETAKENSGGQNGEVDLDLTELSSTMVYSEVYNMMSAPDNYIGKTVKMDGVFATYHDEATGKDYYACVIADATACCSQGIEFVLTDDYTYPDDYPKEGGEICVIGVFDTYTEGENTYCTLRDARIV